jgi:hypothetical protein
VSGYTFGITALSYELPAVSSPSAAMADSCQTFTNGFYSQSSQAGNWTSWAYAFAFWETGASDAYAFQQLRSAAGDSLLDFCLQYTSFAFALLSSGLSFVATDLKSSDPGLAMANSDASIVLGVLSVVLEIPALAKLSATRTLDFVILGMDAATVGISIAEVSSGY